MLVECPLNPKEKRQRLAEILFEELKIPSLGLMNSAALSLFSTGRTRGCVLEVGAGVSHAVPIFEGYSLPHAIQRLDVAGNDISSMLKNDLINNEYSMSNDIEFDQHIDKIKEKMCSVAIDYEQQINSNDKLNINQRSYELPDGSMIEVNHK